VAADAEVMLFVRVVEALLLRQPAQKLASATVARQFLAWVEVVPCSLKQRQMRTKERAG
jgi:hypothetical protein